VTNGDFIQVLPPEAPCLSPDYAGSLGVACEFTGSLLYYLVVLTL